MYNYMTLHLSHESQVLTNYLAVSQPGPGKPNSPLGIYLQLYVGQCM